MQKKRVSPSSVENGQALLIVVLGMVITLVIALSLVTRSLTNVRVSKEEESSQKAFSAAEAGVEQALKNNIAIVTPRPLGNSATINTVKITSAGSNSFIANGGSIATVDEGADVWLSTWSGTPATPFNSPLLASGTVMTIAWGGATDTCASSISTTPAIEVILLTGTKSSPKSTHYAFDPCSARSAAPGGNRFSTPSIGPITIAGKTFAYSTNITLASTGLIARVIPVYAPSFIGVTSATTFPAQGSAIESEGASGGTVRKVSVYKEFPKIPNEFFQYLILSPK